MKAISHFKIITNHKLLVMKYCFIIGLYKQGLLHDLSKYSPTEFLVGARYFQGDQSPNNAERIATGCSKAWLHHKGRNKHHNEYWMDFSFSPDKKIEGMKMPIQYVAEMFVDRMCASKVYYKETYTDKTPWKYYSRGKDFMIIHPDSRQLLEKLLKMLYIKGEKKTLGYIKHVLLKQTDY